MTPCDVSLHLEVYGREGGGRGGRAGEEEGKGKKEELE